MPELVKRCREERSLQKDLGSSPSEELIYAAPIPDYETDRLGLLVVTKDGLRVLLSTSKRSGAPTDLHLRAVLPPLPAGPQGAAARPTCAAAYQHAALAVCTVPGNGEAGTCDVAASFQRQQPVTEAPGSFAVQGIPGTTATSAALPPGVVLKPGVVTLSTPRKVRPRAHDLPGTWNGGHGMLGVETLTPMFALSCSPILSSSCAKAALLHELAPHLHLAPGATIAQPARASSLPAGPRGAAGVFGT